MMGHIEDQRRLADRGRRAPIRHERAGTKGTLSRHMGEILIRAGRPLAGPEGLILPAHVSLGHPVRRC